MVERGFEVQCGTIFRATFKDHPLIIVVGLSDNNSVSMSAVLEKDGTELIEDGMGTGCACDIESIEGRWSLDRMLEATDAGLIDKWSNEKDLDKLRDAYRKHLYREYNKPPVILT